MDIDDQHEADKIAADARPIAQLRATCDYLRKVLRNVEHGCDQTGDPTIEHRVDDITTTLTAHILVAINAIMNSPSRPNPLLRPR